MSQLLLFQEVVQGQRLVEALKANDASLQFALIDASMVAGLRHVQLAAMRAARDAARGTLHTRNVHAEIVYNLSPTRSIVDAFRYFGVKKTSTAVLAVRIGGDYAQVCPTQCYSHGDSVV